MDWICTVFSCDEVGMTTEWVWDGTIPIPAQLSALSLPRSSLQGANFSQSQAKIQSPMEFLPENFFPLLCENYITNWVLDEKPNCVTDLTQLIVQNFCRLHATQYNSNKLHQNLQFNLN